MGFCGSEMGCNWIGFGLGLVVLKQGIVPFRTCRLLMIWSDKEATEQTGPPLIVLRERIDHGNRLFIHIKDLEGFIKLRVVAGESGIKSNSFCFY